MSRVAQFAWLKDVIEENYSDEVAAHENCGDQGDAGDDAYAPYGLPRLNGDCEISIEACMACAD